jgi:hypothetical protein
MSMRSNSSFPRPLIAMFALAAATFAVGAAPARSQAPGWDSALPPGEIAHTIEERGYQLVGPLVRHGRVYIANVLGQEDIPERLVIDAHDGRLLHHYPGDPALRRQVGNPNEWSPVATFFDHLFGHQEEVAPLSPPPASDFYETPKPKAQARRAKPESRPAAQPAMAPADNKAPSPTPAVTTTAPITPPPPAATTGAKATPPAPAPETATAAPGAPPQKTSSPKLNDVPVAPLE